VTCLHTNSPGHVEPPCILAHYHRFLLVAIFVVVKSFLGDSYALRYAGLSFVIFNILIKMKPVAAYLCDRFIGKKVCKFDTPS
jgi:hypothetical protein